MRLRDAAAVLAAAAALGACGETAVPAIPLADDAIAYRSSSDADGTAPLDFEALPRRFAAPGAGSFAVFESAAALAPGMRGALAGAGMPAELAPGAFAVAAADCAPGERWIVRARGTFALGAGLAVALLPLRRAAPSAAELADPAVLLAYVRLGFSCPPVALSARADGATAAGELDVPADALSVLAIAVNRGAGRERLEQVRACTRTPWVEIALRSRVNAKGIGTIARGGAVLPGILLSGRDRLFLEPERAGLRLASPKGRLLGLLAVEGGAALRIAISAGGGAVAEVDVAPAAEGFRSIELDVAAARDGLELALAPRGGGSESALALCDPWLVLPLPDAGAPAIAVLELDGPWPPDLREIAALAALASAVHSDAAGAIGSSLAPLAAEFAARRLPVAALGVAADAETPASVDPQVLRHAVALWRAAGGLLHVRTRDPAACDRLAGDLYRALLDARRQARTVLAVTGTAPRAPLLVLAPDGAPLPSADRADFARYSAEVLEPGAP